MSVALRHDQKTAYIEFDNPDSKVNILNFDTLRKLDGLLDEVKSSSPDVLIFVSKKPRNFIAGADIKQIESLTEPGDGAQKAKLGQDIFNKIEDLAMPTVCVINGTALGGGCELALACRFRIATFDESVKIGLPEVNLGILPGFGGTVRLPRLVGLQEALKMILTGKAVDGKKALKIGLVDRLVPDAGLENFVKVFVGEVLGGKIKNRFPRMPKKGFAGFLDGNPLGRRIVFQQSRKNVLQTTKGFYPAPLKIIDVIENNIGRSRGQALAVESEGFGSLVVTDTCKNLIHLFYLSEKYKKLRASDAKAQPVEKCGVLGAGVMGGGIAQILATKNITVRLKDINYDSIAKGLQAAAKVFSQSVQRRRITQADAARMMGRVSGGIDYSGFKSADMVIEAVVENMAVKKQVFQELSRVCSADCVLATNTSALSVTEMSQDVVNPGRVIGFHFFNPVHRMPLVEVITTDQTTPETIETSLALCRRLGKTPILVKDSCGFVVNRILLLYINEAGRIFDETGDLEGIDRVMTGFGMPMGPFTLSDEVGLDVGVKVMKVLNEHFGARYDIPHVFKKVAEKKWLGKKSGKGFYIHDKKRKVNPEALSLKEGPRKTIDPDEIRQRLVFTMINEAAKCLDDGIVEEADAIDVGMIFGTGFPPFYGGLLKYADSVGIERVLSCLTALESKDKDGRFEPSPYLLRLKSEGRTFLNSNRS